MITNACHVLVIVVFTQIPSSSLVLLFFVLSDRSFKSFIFHSTTPALISTFFLFYFSRNELLCLFLLFSSKISSLTFFFICLNKINTTSVDTFTFFCCCGFTVMCTFNFLFSFLALLLFFFVNKKIFMAHIG